MTFLAKRRLCGWVREKISGALYHVSARRTRRSTIFHGVVDDTAYLSRLANFCGNRLLVALLFLSDSPYFPL